MELTKLKNILNTGEVTEENLPGYSIGKVFNNIGNAFKKDGFFGKEGGLDKFLERDNKIFGTNGAAIGTAATGVLDMVNGIGAAGKYNKTANDLLQDAGTAQQNIGGVGYTVQNDINKSAEEAQVDAETKSSTLGLAAKGATTGAAIASVIPGVGTAVGGIVGGVAGLVGGLFGGGAKKREMKKQMRLAEIKRINTNDFNRSGALTTVLLNDLALTEGNQENQVLYAANGKALGGQKQNAWGSNGEHKIEVDASGNVISDERLGTGVDNKDTVPIHVNPNTIILPNKKVKLPGGQEIIPSRYYEQTGDLLGAEYATRMNIQNKKYKNGKLPGFIDGYLSNIIGHGLPMLSEIFLGNKISSQDIEHNSTNVKNPFESQALYTLGQQRENPYAIVPELYDEYAKGMYAISNAGGLGGGQRALARLSAMNNFMNQSAKLQQAAQAANIGHRQTYANALLTAGAKSAENEAAALRYDLDRYSRAHAAKLAGEQEARKGAWSQFMAGIKGIVDNKRYNDTMDLYRQKSKIENDYYEALTRNLLGNKVTADNSKDWSWLPSVYGQLNKNAGIKAQTVDPGAFSDPTSLTNSGLLAPKMYKYTGPTLTEPAPYKSGNTITTPAEVAQLNSPRPMSIVTPDSRENTLTSDASARAYGRYNYDLGLEDDNKKPNKTTTPTKKPTSKVKPMEISKNGNIVSPSGYVYATGYDENGSHDITGKGTGRILTNKKLTKKLRDLMNWAYILYLQSKI